MSPKLGEPLYTNTLTEVEELRWTGAHIKRFLELATSNGKLLVIYILDKPTPIYSLEDLKDFVSWLRVVLKPHFQEGRKVPIAVFFNEKEQEAGE